MLTSNSPTVALSGFVGRSLRRPTTGQQVATSTLLITSSVTVTSCVLSFTLTASIRRSSVTLHPEIPSLAGRAHVHPDRISLAFEAFIISSQLPSPPSSAQDDGLILSRRQGHRARPTTLRLGIQDRLLPYAGRSRSRQLGQQRELTPSPEWLIAGAVVQCLEPGAERAQAHVQPRCARARPLLDQGALTRKRWLTAERLPSLLGWLR